MNPVRWLGALLGLLCLAAAPPHGKVLIRGAHVFDGSGAPATIADVLISGDRIAAVGPRLRPPRRARIVRARGLTLLPGLHDLHTHMRSPGAGGPDDLGKAYASHLLHGITTAVDFSLSGEMLVPIREMTASGRVTAPNQLLAVRIGVPGGHGTERGWGDFFTLEATTPRAANLVMDRALSYRPDVIKVFTDGWRYGRTPDLNSMDLPTLRTIVERAHAVGIPVITHTVSLHGARIAAAAGVDALGHGIGDTIADDALIAAMRDNHVAYIPTMAVYEPQVGRQLNPVELASLAAEERTLEAARPAPPAESGETVESRRWQFLTQNLRRMQAGGVTIGLGTDAGIGGVYHGWSAVREIRLFTQHGFTPAQALAAATSVSAAIIRQGEQHGRIAPGQRADLLLVAGRPDLNIDDIDRVRRVFVAGREIPLEPLRRRADAAEPSPLPVHLMPGPIDSIARADGRTDLDTLPFSTSEAGTDHSHLDLARGADSGRTFLVARMGAAPQPRAALVLPLTRGPVHVADARAFDGVAIQARGAGRYSVVFDSYGVDGRASFRSIFTPGPELSETRIPFAVFASPETGATLDLARLRALIIQLEGEPGGTAWLDLGTVRFYRE